MEQQDKRTLHSLRKHINELITDGASIIGRDPLTLLCEGLTLKVKQGMLVGYTGPLGLVEPLSGHEWPDPLRQMAIDLCIQQLQDAIRALEGWPVPPGAKHPASGS